MSSVKLLARWKKATIQFMLAKSSLLAFTVLEMTGPWLLLSYAEVTLSSSLTGLLDALENSSNLTADTSRQTKGVADRLIGLTAR